MTGMMADERVFIVAEAGVNHDGCLDTALALVEAAADAGADAVKFQTFSAARLASRRAPKADYQKATTAAGDSQYEMLKALELSAEAHLEIAGLCAARHIEFLSTPFDEGSLRFLVDACRIRRIKISSSDLTNGPLLLSAGATGLPVIVSTGMATLGDIEAALGVLAYGYGERSEPPGRNAFVAAYADPTGRRRLRNKVALLHCTTAYPTPVADVNLRAMATLAAAFGLDVGYSDHTRGITVAVAAAARGARVIEKHVTLDRSRPGPDHAASLEPRELADLVSAVRTVEAALGDGVKAPTAAERINMVPARKSLVTARPVAAGRPLAADDIAVKRPGDGVSPMAYWDILGTVAARAYGSDEAIEA